MTSVADFRARFPGGHGDAAGRQPGDGVYVVSIPRVMGL